MKTRKKFDREFKQMVVDLSYQRGDISALAKEMDIGANFIYRWRKELETHQGASFPGQGNKIQSEEQKEITRLKKALHDAEMERDILKKVVSIFSRSDGKNTHS